jgi:hypothetical protein
MASEPDNLVLLLLREMPAESAKLHAENLAEFRAIGQRLDRIENAQKSFRQALSADSLMSKLLTGDFEERIVALERQVAELAATR